MKRLLIICIVIVSLVFISGCIDEEKTNSKAGDSEPSTVSEINQESETNTQQEEISLMDLEHFIDPQLKNVVIYSSDIEVVRFELNDRREYEDDENYFLKILVSNNGDTPVWMAGPMADYKNLIIHYGAGTDDIYLLKSGERKWFSINPYSNNYFDTQLKNLGSLVIYSHRTVTPIISPELKSLSLSSVHVKSITSGLTSRDVLPPFDIHSIKYEEEGGWKYIIVGMSVNIDSQYGSKNAYLSLEKIGGPTSDPFVKTKFSPVNSGKIEYMKLQIPKSWTIQRIGVIQEIYINFT